MKFAFFVHRYYPVRAGAERYIQKTAEYCASKNNAITVHTTNALDLQSFISRKGQHLPTETFKVNDVHVVRHEIVYPLLRRYWGNLLFKINILPNALRGYVHPATPIVPSMRTIQPDYDLIISTAIPYDYINLTSFNLAKRQNIPFIIIPFLHLGDLNDPNDSVRCYYTQKHQLDLIRKADGVIVQTDIEKNFLIDSEIDADRIVRIGQGIEPRAYKKRDPSVFRKKFNIPNNAFIIGHLGNLSYEKGSLDLLEIFNKFPEANNIYLVCAGSEMDSYKQYITSMKPHNNFRNLGIIDDETRDNFFSSIDCFCLPSRVESFGVVFLESWLFEKPVIAYQSGGIPGIIDHNKDGFLVKTGDKISLADTISYVHRNYKSLGKLGIAGRKKVETNYTLDVINQKTYNFLHTIAQQQ